MYLKSLVLKGFKSFADRSILELQPGITAVVGPNGSGKSNISDAVLWVLGERNARNLRGQSMEDVIFSGSAARKAVSMAEVELVLDNSDGTLPVDFDEVSIGRRMYRSGESEYLINGVVARRLDVLDILHDTGLGTGTHSIISQGNLDTILQSSPADRRALIEEAAGVLKHKQRKEKSARKLEKMDNHLARVRDVAAEVSRQLGPLERKAKRAQAYKKASAELSELKLALAVDDLRRLQSEWDAVCARESQLAADIDAKRANVQSTEQRVSDLQELIRRKSEDAGELSRHQRRIASVEERLDSASLLLRERKRAAQGYEDDMRLTLEGSQAREENARRELEEAKRQFEEAQAASTAATADVEKLSKERYEAAEKRRAAERELEELTRKLSDTERQLAEAQRNQEALKESLSSGIAHERLVDARRVELSGDLERASAERDAANEALAAGRALLEQYVQDDRQAQVALGERFEQQEVARSRRDGDNESLHVVEAEIKAVEQAQRASRADDPALSWLMDHVSEFSGDLSPISHALKAPANLERIVELLLGDDLAALAVEDADSACKVAQALLSAGRSGDVSFVLRTDAVRAARADARKSNVGHALVDDLSYPEASRRIVEALLGDVVVCESADQAFSAHDADKTGLRFVSLDGCVVWPEGKVRVFGAANGEDEGVLARERRLDSLRERREQVQASCKEAEQAVSVAEEAYREAQAASLKASQTLAAQRGVVDAAEEQSRKAEERVAALMREMSTIDQQVEGAKSTLAKLRPSVEAAENLAKELRASIEDIKTARDAKSEEIAPLRSEAGKLGEQLNEAKLRSAQLSERKAYAERMVVARNREVEQLVESQLEAKRSLAVKRVARDRANPLLAVLDEIAATLRKRASVIERAVQESEGTANDYHAASNTARDEARAARDAFDAANDLMTQARIEKGRLEVQVEAAVNVVVHDCETPLDHVDELPQLEDRSAAEDSVFTLERRIKNMGTINPDAAEEFEKLKERYDFLASQLNDMEQARKSLAKIVRIIDARMKDDFVNTFEQVNKNFSEIFSELFPGGTASLVLENPDDIENTGVEVTAQPRGKRITKMMLMSGGEKSLTALALLFAVYRIRSTPFYILDEVEAALDDTNLRRLVLYIDKLRSSTQLIMITHQRRTMEMADVLFGVSMQSDGVTKVISQRLERALELAEE